ncbi:PREDICTED: uncharacterized protein LOC106742352 [Dinoponera quadriceps]|uniref:Uncharacterized protein LOC106742352 n=1 Tax=Dinoponera quadriceps TaxID=609295 RepID=A0A6P3WYJ2_DINQU|nr:PREDICTED: uncharacterized protein LOC106742352 [Dinoponera quadriceps]XP_014470695.1 PREDICTED: uncharacterized protein LOC106742352 [Dinoponera quadriceps]
MQDSSKNTPKSERVRRVHKAGMSDMTKKTLSDTLLPNIRTITSRNEPRSNRRTMMSNDIQTLKLKKGITASRQSIMPSQSLLDIQKSTDTESKDLELSLLYDEYLRSMLTNLIIEKKTEEKKHYMITQLATITQEIDQDMKKLIKIKTREQDIKNLSLEQTETDVQLAAIIKCTKNEMFNMLKDKLSKLQSLLEPLDILCCNNIILPDSPLQWKEIEEVLKKCSKILEDIINLIGSKGNTYCTVNNELKNFSETYNEIEDIQKKLLEALCNLQVRMLKNASLIMQSESQQILP